MAKVWTLSVELASFGLVTTVHSTEEEAVEHLADEYGVGKGDDPSDEMEEETGVIDYEIGEHEVGWLSDRDDQRRTRVGKGARNASH